MKIVIIGYGRVGSRTVDVLAVKGHSISVVDKEAMRLSRAAHHEGVELIQGNGIDVDVQRDAGMDTAELLLAVTRDDNVNLMAAQVARSYFNVPRAIARIYEPSHAEATQEDPKLSVVCPTLNAVQIITGLVEGRVSQTGAVIEATPRTRPRYDEAESSRYILVAGGGKVGVNLARALLESGHEVGVIERDGARAANLAARLDCPVYVGDSSTHDVLEEAGVARARVFVAATGSDQDNLISCQLAKKTFGVPKTISRASNPKNEEVMARLGVDSTVSSTAIIQHVIESELPTVRIKKLLSLQEGAFQIIEYAIDDSSPATGQFVRDLDLPLKANLIAVLRGSATVVPRGDTQLNEGDVLVALVSTDQEALLREALLGG
ncbi:MAG TPA: NAD-binding protein [Blastocatellia bacterium]|nr:NAD-binding protein [Blastocatellia bacterium]